MLSWLPKIRPRLESLCATWAIPVGVPVGWIQEESGGDPKEVTPLGELGYFQIHPDESKDLGFDHARIGTDPDYGIGCGFRVMDHYRKYARNRLNEVGAGGVPDGSELLWRYAKFCHSIGAGAARKCFMGASDECLTWERFTIYCSDHAQELRAMCGHDPLKWIGLVNRVFMVGAPFGTSTMICQGPPSAPSV